MTTYWCTDGYGEMIEIEADSADEAAREYVDDGDWGENDQTSWVHVWVYTYNPDDPPELADDEPGPADPESIRVDIPPDEPGCVDKWHDHVWATPYELLGGLEENPGVQGHGGGAMGEEVCVLCGCAKHWDSWATDPVNGEQGLDSVRYEKDAYLVDIVAEDALVALTIVDGVAFAVTLGDDKAEAVCSGDEVMVGDCTYVARREDDDSMTWRELEEEV